jgi:threonyl-tRNA synthetase
MRVLFLICNKYRSYNIKKSSNVGVFLYSSANKREEKIENCLGVFVCIEIPDGLKQVRRCLNDVRKICQKNKLKNILIAPFSHLSHKLASPEKAIKLIQYIEEILKKDRYNVLRSSFGFHKNLFLEIKGCEDNIRWRDYGSS